METVNITINGIACEAPKGSTILAAAKLAGIDIPTLCFLKDINEIGACRICMVEADEGRGARLVASCVYPISEGMKVYTNTPKVLGYRKKTLELILSDHDKKCLSCVRSGKCELQALCQEMGVEDVDKYKGIANEFEIDDSAAHMVRDNNKCINCRRCIAACEKTQGIGVIGANNRGFITEVSSPFGMGLGDTSCVSCGQCIAVCPVGAIYEKSDADKILEAIADPEKHVIVQTAPAVRAGLGEMFDLPIGTPVEGKMAAALRRIGFERVFDTDFAADVTIMEEANELLQRVTTGGVLPMITSCSPGWIKYAEHYYPDQLEHLSSCKSPQQMFGGILKTYYAQKMGWDPKSIVSVSIMPCTAKKFEIGREDQSAAGDGIPDLDYTMTTRELGRLVKRCGIDFVSLPDEGFDDPMGESTGAAVIFGVTGGVMEAALRTAVWKLTGETNDSPIEFKEVRGFEGIKEATYTAGGVSVKVAIASGLSNAKVIMDKIRAGEADYTFVEVMACPGGCINGGGQPQVPAKVRNFEDYRAKRASVLYGYDSSMPIRKSHENPSVQKLYAEFMGEPCGEKAHHILHTSYVKRKVHDIDAWNAK